MSDVLKKDMRQKERMEGRDHSQKLGLKDI